MSHASPCVPLSQHTRSIASLPVEIQQNIAFFLRQSDLLRLSLVANLYHELATRVLYSKIYLNDSYIENSEVYRLAPTWSWLQLSSSVKDPEVTKNEANSKLSLLLRTFREHPRLMSNVLELRLNWDLDISLQKDFIELMMNNSKSLKIIENITNQSMNDAIEFSKYRNQLASLDLPPPNPLPSVEIPPNYLLKTKTFMKKRILVDDISMIRNMTIFLEPLLLFNNIVKPKRKFQLENIKIHCRADSYPPMVFRTTDRSFQTLSDIFDVRTLKVLTMISWFDSQPPDSMFLFDQWSSFKFLEDITLIAVVYDDEKISNLIESCYCLKRLKLDFSTPRREISQNCKIYKSLFKHRNSLTFLDMKLSLTHRIVNLDVREFLVVVRIPCKCSLCQKRVAHSIFREKILGTTESFKVNNLESFRAVDFFEQFFISNLSPYAKAVDRYPSVKTGPDDVNDLLERFNEINMERIEFQPLNEEDFYDLYHCLIHSMKPDLEPFVEKLTSLKFFVLNDISFIINEDITTKQRYPEPLFYNKGFKTNFGSDDIIHPKTFDEETYGRALTIY